MLYELGRFLARIGACIAFSIRTEGKENVPLKGGLVVASNHQTYWDPVFLVVFIKHRFRFMAKEELFQKNKAFAWLIKGLGAFPVIRGKGDTTAMDTAVETVRNGQDLVIFPEGTRSKDGTLGKPKSGAVVIAAKTGAPILPVAICYEGKLKFRKRVTIKYGKPIEAEILTPALDNPAEIKRCSRMLMERIAALLGVST